MFLSFSVLDNFFSFLNFFGFLGILGPPYCGIGATIRIGREMLCLPYAGFFLLQIGGATRWRVCYQRGLPRLVANFHCM